ncbi:hypothetical protein CSPX01_13501 [Colletotrichum filicis]|nr:hypothetical protein CSPX01_13501 [Colletotrichum filicis]
MSTNMDQPELLEITPEINDFGRSQGLSRPTAATAATGEKARFMDTENALESALQLRLWYAKLEYHAETLAKLKTILSLLLCSLHLVTCLGLLVSTATCSSLQFVCATQAAAASSAFESQLRCTINDLQHSKHTLSQVTVVLEPLEHPPTLADSQEIALPQISFAPRVNGNLDSWLSPPAQHDVAVRRCPEPRPRLPILEPIIQLPAADYLVSVVIAVVGITDCSHWTTYGPCYEDGSKTPTVSLSLRQPLCPINARLSKFFSFAPTIKFWAHSVKRTEQGNAQTQLTMPKVVCSSPANTAPWMTSSTCKILKFASTSLDQRKTLAPVITGPLVSQKAANLAPD